MRMTGVLGVGAALVLVVVLGHSSGSPGVGIVFPVLVSLVPLLVVIAFILIAASAFSRARTPHRFDALARLGELRERGIVTEDEFQSEKRRILK